MRSISNHLDWTDLVNKGFIIWLLGKFFLRDTAGSPKQARWLACSGSQSHRVIRFILPAREASHIRSGSIEWSSLLMLQLDRLRFFQFCQTWGLCSSNTNKNNDVQLVRINICHSNHLNGKILQIILWHQIITSQSIFSLCVLRRGMVRTSCGCIFIRCYLFQQQKDQQKKTKKKLFGKLAKVTRGSKRKSVYCVFIVLYRLLVVL